MKKQTKSTKAADIKRSWHLVDAKDKILGKVAVEVAGLLIGKSKPYFVRNMDCGDHVVVINAKHVKVTGNKEKEKMYSNYSGYPGGLKQKALWQLREEKPDEIIRHAVKGMVPKNKLQQPMMNRLHIHPQSEHEFTDKFTK